MQILGGKIETPGHPNQSLVSMVGNGDRVELGILWGNLIYHKYMSGGSVRSQNGNTLNNSTSALLRVSMDDFEFEWGGTQCGTTIVNAPSTFYSGRTELFYDGAQMGNNVFFTINGPTSKAIQFRHYVKRENDNVNGSQDEKYYVSTSEGTIPSTAPGVPGSTSLEKGVERIVHDTGSFTVNLNPGQTVTRWHNLNFLLSNVNDALYANVGRYSITLTRPYAKFSGTTSATMTKNSGTAVNIPANHTINLTDSDNGRYDITFNSTIKRQDEAGKTAGGTVVTQYQTSSRVPNTVPGASAVTWTGSASASGNTNALADGGSQLFTAKASGTLKYGETRTICHTMKYRARQTSSDALTNASGSEYCITITRPMKKCDLDPNYSFGLISGKNIAQLNVTNTSLNLSASADGVSKSAVSIYARPADQY